MSKRRFLALIAAAVKAELGEWQQPTARCAIESVATRIVAHITDVDPDFAAAKFLKACGVSDDVIGDFELDMDSERLEQTDGSDEASD